MFGAVCAVIAGRAVDGAVAAGSLPPLTSLAALAVVIADLIRANRPESRPVISLTARSADATRALSPLPTERSLAASAGRSVT